MKKALQDVTALLDNFKAHMDLKRQQMDNAYTRLQTWEFSWLSENFDRSPANALFGRLLIGWTI